VKIHDFGLWFGYLKHGGFHPEWSATIPQGEGYFGILYDGVELGYQYSDFNLMILDHQQLIMRLKYNFPLFAGFYRIGRPLTLDDFEIIPNPDYRGN
jgi:hypothetical protein